jgi:hypothetical protein
LLIIWLSIALPFVLTLIGTGVPVLLFWVLGWQQATLAVAGIGLLTFSYIVLMRLVLLIFHPANQVLAVAHTVVKEASRTRLSLVFIVLLLVILPLLPLWLDPESPVRYQIQTFISRSMGLTFFIAACMTLFLSCATVAFEIRDRQIWQLMTKPLNRVHYLLGKWLGVISVNLILLIVSGVSTFTFIQYLRERPTAAGFEGQMDAISVENEVLTARRSMLPKYQTLEAVQIRERVRQLVERDPEIGSIEDVPLEVLNKLSAEVQEAYLLGLRTIPPMDAREYEFAGLGSIAGDPSAVITLRYRFHILRSDEHEVFPALFMFNRDPNERVRRTYVPTMSHVLPIPSRLVREDGTMTITVANPYQPGPEMRGYGSINFELSDFELLYKVGNFEPNFARAVLINWIKLAFLAMLGVTCSTFLNFSVSCLLSFTLFTAGLLGPFLSTALGEWSPTPTSQMDWGNIALVVQWGLHWFIKAIAEVLVFTLGSFGEISATQYLVEGKFISWGFSIREILAGTGVLGTFLRLVVIWSGVSLLIGYLVIRSRQLAIYSGHG